MKNLSLRPCGWLAALLLVLGLPAGADAAMWKPAKGALMTRWARDVTPETAHQEYPRPQMRRDKWLNLNGLWQLDFARAAAAPPIGKDLPQIILVPFPVESALSGVMKPADRLWYRRSFTVPKEWAGQRLLLHFGAVDWEATVWVNGHKVGTHRGGYDAFSFDITDALQREGPQEIVVGVWDPSDESTQPHGKQVRKPGGIMYTSTTGIWQTVWLEPVPAVSIDRLVIVPDVDGNKVRVTAHTRGEAAGHVVHVVASDGQARMADASGAPGTPISLSLLKPKLWTPETPFLYGLRVELQRDNRPVDVVDSYFGMRKISVGRDDKGVTRLLLNNKPVFQSGPLDQGFWPDGLYTAPSDEALAYDIEMMKKLGFNMVRKHVKVEPARWYHWCDRLGLLVWQDMPSGDRGISGNQPDLQRTPPSARQYEQELRAMIDGLRNSPAVVGWVVFNEGWGQFDTPRITRLAKQLDETRLVDCASGWTDRGVGDVHDIHAYPGPAAPDPEPLRAAFLGEFGGLGLAIEGHTWTNKTWGYRGTNSKEELTRKYEKLWKRVWELKEKPGLSGAVYTQLTDVETEANGLLTYDRAVVKVDLERAAAAARGDLSRMPVSVPVVPTSRGDKAATWRYTTTRPADGWAEVRFNDSTWQEGPGGFGTKGTPGTNVRTEWKTPDIWLRRTVQLPPGPLDGLHLLLHHDEDTEVYLNGVLAARVKDFTVDYEETPIEPRALEAIKPGGTVVIAIHCRQTQGGQYIDAGLGVVRPRQ